MRDLRVDRDKTAIIPIEHLYGLLQQYDCSDADFEL